MASYPTSVKAFTTKVDGAGNKIFAAHVNDIQDEVSAIETGLEGTLQHHVKVAAAKYFFGDARAVGDGVFSTPGFFAADYTASAGNWTVITGNVAVMRYTLVGRMMTVYFIISSTNVTAGPVTLSVKIPAGFTALNTCRNLVQVSDAGTPGTGVARVSGSGGTTIDFFKNTTGTAWTLTAGSNTDIFGQIAFEVN